MKTVVVMMTVDNDLELEALQLDLKSFGYDNYIDEVFEDEEITQDKEEA
jgi:hypothetical protein